MSDTESVIESAALATTPETEDYTESCKCSLLRELTKLLSSHGSTLKDTTMTADVASAGVAVI